MTNRGGKWEFKKLILPEEVVKSVEVHFPQFLYQVGRKSLRLSSLSSFPCLHPTLSPLSVAIFYPIYRHQYKRG